MRNTRRDLLVGLGTTGVPALVAGCSATTTDGENDTTRTNESRTPTETATPTETPNGGTDPDSLEGYVRPEADPETVPDELVCEDEEFERHSTGYGSVSWGETADGSGRPVFALRVNERSFRRGDDVQLTLTNLTDEEIVRGGLIQHNVEVYTDDGWQEVRGWADGTELAYPDEGIPHAPGERAEWTLPLSEERLQEVYSLDLVFCPDLSTGRYRFVLWGVSGAVAVAFDVGA